LGVDGADGQMGGKKWVGIADERVRANQLHDSAKAKATASAKGVPDPATAADRIFAGWSDGGLSSAGASVGEWLPVVSEAPLLQ